MLSLPPLSPRKINLASLSLSLLPEGVEEAEGRGHEVDEEVVVVPRPQLGEPEGQDRRQQEERVEDCQAPERSGSKNVPFRTTRDRE